MCNCIVSGHTLYCAVMCCVPLANIHPHPLGAGVSGRCVERGGPGAAPPNHSASGREQEAID